MSKEFKAAVRNYWFEFGPATQTEVDQKLITKCADECFSLIEAGKSQTMFAGLIDLVCRIHFGQTFSQGERGSFVNGLTSFFSLNSCPSCYHRSMTNTGLGKYPTCCECGWEDTRERLYNDDWSDGPGMERVYKAREKYCTKENVCATS